MIDKGLQVDALTCLRGETLLFRDLSFTLQPGEGLFVRGANGAGKSSLLRLLAGLLRPAAGTIRLNGIALADDPVAYRAGIAWLGHQDGLKAGETAAEAVAYRARLAGRQPPANALATMGMAAQADTPIRYLSAGQKRRVAMAGVIATGAKVWLLDEPDTALDDTATALFHAALTLHLEFGGVAEIATHNTMPLSPNMTDLKLSPLPAGEG